MNVTFAQDRLEEDLGFSGAVYGFGAGIFFIGYFLLEVPCNLALHRFGARKWMARIMITWGLISACTMFVSSPASFYAVRFLLGIAEAGFFPGMILYLRYWFPARERARAVGVFMSAIAISYAIGAPISGGIMAVIGGVAGLEDWQWLFLLEAIPAIVAGVLVFLKLPDGPEDANWLRGRREALAAATLDGEEAPSARDALDRRGASRTAACCVFAAPVLHDGRQRLRPLVLGRRDRRPDQRHRRRDQGLRHRDPVHGRDRRHDRDPALPRPHGRAQAPSSRSALAVAAAAFVASTVVGPVAAIPALAVGLFFLLGVHGVFWTMPAALLSGAAAAAGIALINSIGNIGGFVGPYLVGLVKDATGSTDGGLITLAAILAIGSAIALQVAHEQGSRARPKRAHAHRPLRSQQPTRAGWTDGRLNANRLLARSAIRARAVP